MPQVNNPGKEKLEWYFNKLDEHIASICEPVWIKYLDLGTKTVRLINYSSEFTPHVEKQLSFVLKDKCSRFDATLVIWQESDIDGLVKTLEPEFKTPMLWVCDDSYSKTAKCIMIDGRINNTIGAHNTRTNTFYWGIQNLEAEEFIKHGHMFVLGLNRILKTKTAALVHGAVVGLDNKGVLLCARGQRGKSTLAVFAMIDGFEYVSDDYLTLEKDGENLYAHPIYSIITLSPRMYNELYDVLEGKFVSNNARKDKYVINIDAYHDRFKKRYPVSVCMFPEITDAQSPSILPCTQTEKGRAIVHLIHSTINQMCDNHDIETIKKLIDFVKGFEFYKINLCADIKLNNRILREFITNYNPPGHFEAGKNKEKINAG